MEDRNKKSKSVKIDERQLSIIIFSLFFSWVLAFTFEGQVLYTLAQRFQIDPQHMIFGGVAATFGGLLLGGFFARDMVASKRIFLSSIVICFFSTLMFFFEPSIIWTISIVLGAFLGGISIAAWGYYYKNGTPTKERIKTAASGLIYSNVLMILINMVAVHISPYAGLGFCLLVLAASFGFSTQLPIMENKREFPLKDKVKDFHVKKTLMFLSLFILVITINSGLMYQVINPAFAHHEWLVSWYWAIPYIVALYIIKNLRRTTNRTYTLYVAIAMIGFAFIAFIVLDRSAVSYLVVNTLMLGACGVYDLFWWSILGEMLDWHQNAAKILGTGLSANVLGVLLGGYVGNKITTSGMSEYNTSILALSVVLVTLILLPVLHKHLTNLMEDHVFLTVLSELSEKGQNKEIRSMIKGKLTERELEIANLLLHGKTYRMIAGELFLSENTVKTHVKNIYSKLEISSRMELIGIMISEQQNNSLEKG